MTTILPIGTCVCQACRQPVAIVRRTVEMPCDHSERYRLTGEPVTPPHHHAIPDVAWTVVDADGERHLCPAAAA